MNVFWGEQRVFFLFIVVLLVVDITNGIKVIILTTQLRRV